MTLAELRQKHPQFTFRSMDWEVVENDLNYSFEFVMETVGKEAITFTHKHTLNDVGKLENFALINKLVFSIGLSILPSYWKTACSPKIVIEAGYLSEEQIEWWRKLWIKGLGEFFFVNQIKDFQDPNFVKISVERVDGARDKADQIGSAINFSGVLIPVGGGKDSVVSLELIKKAKANNDSDLVKPGIFLFNPYQPSLTIADESGLPTVTATHDLDSKLLDLNDQGYLNGHTPFSAYLAFNSALVAYVFGYKYIALANERSANEGNIHFQGVEINHQYSKSFEFETDFRSYCERYLFGKNSPEYFSFLRPLYEIQIGRLFAEIVNTGSDHGEHIAKSFISCNKGFRTGSWCENCSKCLFVYVTLYPFLSQEKMRLIFSHDLFEDEALLKIALDLTEHGSHKPLECVGMYEESIVAFHLSYQKVMSQGGEVPVVLQKIHDQVLANEVDLDKRSEELLNGWNEDHALPAKFEKILKAAL